jgi:hypothetical protein
MKKTTDRFLSLSGIVTAAMGVAWLLPVAAAWLEAGALAMDRCIIASLGPILVLVGVALFWLEARALRPSVIPPPVRAVIAGNILFLSFCALEFSDGLMRQNGRVFYWTSVLFLPALAVFCGQVLAQRWAWWAARIVAGLFTLWFVGFLLLIPFVHLRGNGGPTPWWGRIYVAAVTSVFAGVSVYVFRSLGRVETRTYYGLTPAVGPLAGNG